MQNAQHIIMHALEKKLVNQVIPSSGILPQVGK